MFESLIDILKDISYWHSRRIRKKLITSLEEQISKQEKVHFERTFNPVTANLPEGYSQDQYTTELSQLKINNLPKRAQFWAAGDHFGNTRPEYVKSLRQIQGLSKQL